MFPIVRYRERNKYIWLSYQSVILSVRHLINNERFCSISVCNDLHYSHHIPGKFTIIFFVTHANVQNLFIWSDLWRYDLLLHKLSWIGLFLKRVTNPPPFCMFPVSNMLYHYHSIILRSMTICTKRGSTR